MKILNPLFAFAAAFLMLFTNSCNRIDPEDSKSEETLVKRYMKEDLFSKYYYWNEEVTEKNKKVDIANYGIEDCFNALLYSKDRWSWMCDKDSYVQKETGVYTGTWGFAIAQPYEYFNSSSIYVSLIYPGSPLEQYGVTRGAMVKCIAGKSVEAPLTSDKVNIYNTEIKKSTQTFTFTLTNGKDTTFTASRAMSLSTRSSHRVMIFNQDDFEGLNEPVGYFNYLSFNQNMTGDITSAMKSFKDAGVKKLIIDLRYNGGGSSVASELLINYLAPKTANGLVYVNRIHNKLLSKNDWDESTKIERNADALDLDRIYFITGEGTASASEMVINGLEPYMDILAVGDTTYGKPNGMYVFYYPSDKSSIQQFNSGDYDGLKYVFLPISFYNTNSKGVQIPDDGMIPDHYCPDDVFHDFDAQEANIKACLSHIVTGSFPGLPKRYGTKSLTDNGILIKPEWETDPHYGLYTVPME